MEAHLESLYGQKGAVDVDAGYNGETSSDEDDDAAGGGEAAPSGGEDLERKNRVSDGQHCSDTC